jgi:hypothetical protein
VHRVYREVVRYLIRITPPPGSSHMVLVYTVYLAVIPVLFGAIFAYLKVRSTRLIVAVVACAIFMGAPFVITVTSIRAGSTNCGSWIYPDLNSGSECYSAIETAFRIAFAVGIAGLAIPVIYLIRGRRDGHKNSLLLTVLNACASVIVACPAAVILVFAFIGDLARGQAFAERGDTDTVPATVNMHLLPHERKVISVHRHPAILIGPGVLALNGLLAAAVLATTVLHGNGPLVAAVWIASLMLSARAIWKAIDWTVTYFVVTPQRILLVSGVLTKKVMMLPLSKVTDMSFQRPFTGRLLGFGDFIIESAGQDKPLQIIDHLPYPEQLYLETCGLIFRDSGATEPGPAGLRPRPSPPD